MKPIGIDAEPHAMARVLVAAIVLSALVVLAGTVEWSFVTALDFSVVLEYWLPLSKGLLLTLYITFGSLAFGFILAFLLVVGARAGNRPLRILVVCHTELWRNTPLLVQIFWIHFGLPVLTGVSTSVLVSGMIALTLQASAYLGEVIRGGVEAIPKGQWEAAHALGLPAAVTWFKVILPQALRLMLLPIVNITFSFFKGSTVLSILGVPELIKIGQTVAIYSNKPIEVLSAVGAIYIAMGYAFSGLSRLIEKRLARAELR